MFNIFHLFLMDLNVTSFNDRSVIGVVAETNLVIVDNILVRSLPDLDADGVSVCSWFINIAGSEHKAEAFLAIDHAKALKLGAV